MLKIVDSILTEVARKDDSIRVIVADVGNFRKFSFEYPGQFLNVGVAELNSIGVAAGLAEAGKRVFVYSVAGFILHRAFEQIKFELGYWNQSVTILGTGVGWRYHQIGRGHHCPEDFALMGLIPNMERHAPMTVATLEKLLRDESDYPRYIRLPENICSEDQLCLSKSEVDILIITLGEVLLECQEAVASLNGINIAVIPIEHLNLTIVSNAVKKIKYKKIMVFEEHVSQGGLGEILFKEQIKVDHYQCLPIVFEHIAKTKSDLKKLYGFDVASISSSILKLNQE
ncbi:hypothetical protein [Maridesulfovibrio sp.]|uniref:hypothetical protein n=1 Tax=Maridesulfovibrio sp. TaxID=2795000 RepID=UPI0039EF7051